MMNKIRIIYWLKRQWKLILWWKGENWIIEMEQKYWYWSITALLEYHITIPHSCQNIDDFCTAPLSSIEVKTNFDIPTPFEGKCGIWSSLYSINLRLRTWNEKKPYENEASYTVLLFVHQVRTKKRRQRGNCFVFQKHVNGYSLCSKIT